jgi:hypothetical protein
VTLTLRAHVQNGRIVVDEGVDLPDGTQVHVAVLDDADQLDDEDRARLHAALERSQAEADAGQVVPAADVIADLRARRR